ncbi:MAG: hypothetical protein DCC75_10955 [Proteobacteria bacterium]|nr:MAG: hypothetical protein DCC75_10955 [Pseudomonadota bacterium]
MHSQVAPNLQRQPCHREPTDFHDPEAGGDKALADTQPKKRKERRQKLDNTVLIFKIALLGELNRYLQEHEQLLLARSANEGKLERFPKKMVSSCIYICF